MTSFILRRFVGVALTIAGMATTIFLLIRLAPGDPATILAGEYGTPAVVQALRQKFALDRPVLVQYGTYLARILQGDFGVSLRTEQPVVVEIATAFPYTIHLMAASLAFSVSIGLTLGILAAYKRRSWLDTALMTAAVAAASVPGFWLGLVLLLSFAYWWPLFPVTGAGDPRNFTDIARHLVLPALAVGVRQTSLVARMTRGSLLETLTQDYVRVAYAKGLATSVVMVRHVLRNAAVPVVTLIGLELGYVLGGSIVTEIVFTRPGMGTLLLSAISARDYPLVQAVVLLWGVMFVTINLLVDLSYPLLDPRLRRAG